MTTSLAGEAAGVPNSPRQRGALRRMPPDTSMAFDSPITRTVRARGAAVVATLLAAVAGSLISAQLARADDSPPPAPTMGDSAAPPGSIPSSADLAAWEAAFVAKARELVHLPPAGTMPAQLPTTTPPQPQPQPSQTAPSLPQPQPQPQPQTEWPPFVQPPVPAAEQPITSPPETPPAAEAPAPEMVTTTTPTAAPETTAPPTGSDPDDALAQPEPLSAPAIATDSGPPSTITLIVQPKPDTGSPTDDTGTPTDESPELPVAEPLALPGPPPASTPFEGRPAPARPLAKHRVPSVRNEPFATVTAFPFPTDLDRGTPASLAPERVKALSSRQIARVRGAPAEDSGARAPLGPLPPLPDAPSSPFGLSAAFSGSAGSAGLVLLAILVVLLVVVPPPLVRRIAISVAAWRGHALAAPLPRPG